MGLTPRQLDVLSALRRYRHLHGYAPTMQELADMLGACKETIFEHLAELQRKGVIRRKPYESRSIEIIQHDVLPDEQRSTTLPMLGRIAAGSPIALSAEREELDLEQLFASERGVYALRVRGDSLAGEHLQDGDTIIVERQDKARHGQMVVTLDGRGIASVGRFDGGTERVMGVVMGMIRRGGLE